MSTRTSQLVAPAPREVPGFEAVFKEYGPYVGRTLRYLGVPAAEFEDACQEVFIVVHRHFPNLDTSIPLHAWIRQVCVHVTRNVRRTVGRRREGSESIPVTREEAHDVSLGVQLRRDLLTILETLDDSQRTVFVLYEIEELEMPEIAKLLGCPLQTAYSRLHAARARVKACAAERGYT